METLRTLQNTAYVKMKLNQGKKYEKNNLIETRYCSETATVITPKPKTYLQHCLLGIDLKRNEAKKINVSRTYQFSRSWPGISIKSASIRNPENLANLALLHIWWIWWNKENVTLYTDKPPKATREKAIIECPWINNECWTFELFLSQSLLFW